MHAAPGTDLSLLRAAATEASALAARMRQRGFRSWQKPGGQGVVTEIDLAVDAMLRERLRAARPDYGWLSEETPDTPERLSRRTVFVVDPIDGTAFLARHADSFAIAAAIVTDGTPVAAAVALPASGALFLAESGRGAYRNGQRLRPSHPDTLDGARMLARRGVLRAEYWQGPPPAVVIGANAPLVYRFCQLASGEADFMISFWRAWEWDIAAGELIAREAGLRTSDAAGNRLRFNRPVPRADGLLVAGPALHGLIRARFRPRPTR